MNICQLVFCCFLVCLISCSGKEKIATPTREDRDSMLLNHIAGEFDYQNIHNGEIAFQLKQLRGGIVTEDDFGDYHLTAFRFGDQRYPPFIVEVVTSDSIVISYFTYTDELYYLNNGIEAVRDSSSKFTMQEDSLYNNAYDHKINLDRNFNELIVKLDIKNDLPAIERLVDLIFYRLLGLQAYADVEIENSLRDVEMTDQLRSHLISEYKRFCSESSNPTYKFRANQGSGGYWRLAIMRTDDGYRIKSKFFSDLLYRAIFL